MVIFIMNNFLFINMDEKLKESQLTTEELAKFCKQKGFVFQSAEIYGGFSGFFDFGPLGHELKQNLKKLYWNEFVHKREDMVGQDGSIITNPKVWKASGHVDNFADLVITTKDTRTKLRADHFIEDELNIPGDALTANDINELIKKHNLTYNGEELEEVKDFNLMFNTQVGASSDSSATAYLRPETAQSIFPNFKIISETSRKQLPFGITQFGKAYRNEISPRDFVFRCREFEQIEMEYFYNPEVDSKVLSDDLANLKVQVLIAENQEKESDKMIEMTIKQFVEEGRISELHAYWLATFYNFFNQKIGLKSENLRIREHTKTELSHYSQATIDIDFKYSMGFKEMFGLANRGNYDLTQHQNLSKQKMDVFDESTKSKVVPHVIEPTVGVERLMMAVILNGYEKDDERGNIVLRLKEKLAPIPVCVFPLIKKPELVDVAKQIQGKLQEEEIYAVFDKSGSIGKRYARYDEIGTMYCLTVDYDSLEDNTITIRNRDTTEQKRISIEDIGYTIRKLLNNKISFKEL